MRKYYDPDKVEKLVQAAREYHRAETELARAELLGKKLYALQTASSRKADALHHILCAFEDGRCEVKS